MRSALIAVAKLRLHRNTHTAVAGIWARLNEALTCPAKPCTCPCVINVTPPSVRSSHANQAVRPEGAREREEREGTRAVPVIRGSRDAKNNEVGVLSPLSRCPSIFVTGPRRGANTDDPNVSRRRAVQENASEIRVRGIIGCVFPPLARSDFESKDSDSLRIFNINERDDSQLESKQRSLCVFARADRAIDRRIFDEIDVGAASYNCNL